MRADGRVLSGVVALALGCGPSSGGPDTDAETGSSDDSDVVVDSDTVVDPDTDTAVDPDTDTAVDTDTDPADPPVREGCDARATDAFAEADLHVDPVQGDDGGDGTAAHPWRSLAPALARSGVAVTVFVHGGQHGLLRETSPPARTGYLTIRAAPGTSPTLTGIDLQYSAPADAWLRVVGFDVVPDHTQGGAVVSVDGAAHVDVQHNNLTPDRYATSDPSNPGNPHTFVGARISNASDVLFEANCVTSVFIGVDISGSQDITVRGNYVTPQSGSGLRSLGGNRGVLLEGNHVHGQPYAPYPEDPNAVDDPHASLISVRSSGLVVRGNLLHGMGTSSGIMFYTVDAAGGESAYTDITIEGNAIYDVRNPTVLRMYNVAERIVVRNNLLAGSLRLDPLTCDGVTNDARYRYNGVVSVNSLAEGYDGSGVHLYNNVLVGAAFLTPAVDERHNVVWSYAEGSAWRVASPSGTSHIAVSGYLGCGNHPDTFEQGLFIGPIDLTPAHGAHVDFTPAAASLLVGFGDAALQTPMTLGALDERGYFLLSGVTRSADQHTAGPFEP